MIQNIPSKSIYEVTPGTKPISSGYEITFDFFDNDQIKVALISNNNQINIDNTYYSVTKIGTLNKLIFNSSYIYPDSVSKLVIYRATPFKQETNLVNGELIDADIIELALDKIVAMCQELKEATQRSLLAPASENSQIIIPQQESRKASLLGFDDNGNPIAVLISDIEQKLAEALRAEDTVIKALDTAAAYAHRAENASDEAYNNRFMTELAKTQALSASMTAKDNAEISANKKIEAERILGTVKELERNIRAIRQEVMQLASQVAYDKANVSSNLSDTITAKNIAVQASLGSQDARSQTESIRASTEAILNNIKDLERQIASTAASSAPAMTMIINGIQYNVSIYTEGLRTYRKLKRVATT